MNDNAPLPRSAFAGLATPGRFGRTAGGAGISVSERTGLALASVLARAGQAEAVAAAFAAHAGVALPHTPRRVEAGRRFALWSGPGQWLVGEPMSAGRDELHGALASMLGPRASISAQGDGRGVLRLSGPAARDVLARGMPIDLHPRAFRPGDVALTACAHLDVLIAQIDEEPSYDLFVARSVAGSFWSWLGETAAPYGLAVNPPLPGISGPLDRI